MEETEGQLEYLCRDSECVRDQGGGALFPRGSVWEMGEEVVLSETAFAETPESSPSEAFEGYGELKRGVKKNSSEREVQRSPFVSLSGQEVRGLPVGSGEKSSHPCRFTEITLGRERRKPMISLLRKEMDEI